jgi:hypothetical protein
VLALLLQQRGAFGIDVLAGHAAQHQGVPRLDQVRRRVGLQAAEVRCNLAGA